MKTSDIKKLVKQIERHCDTRGKAILNGKANKVERESENLSRKAEKVMYAFERGEVQYTDYQKVCATGILDGM